MDLPDSLWLRVVNFLNPAEIVSLSRLSRRWYRISHDRSLWLSADLTTVAREFDLTALKKFIRLPQANHLRSLTFSGSLRRLQSRLQRSRMDISTAFLQDLLERCPSLRHLGIRGANVTNVQLTEFPQSLEAISLQDSVGSFDFFAPLKDPSVLPRLVQLNLDCFNSLSSHSAHSVPAIWSRSGLKALSLSGLFKLSLAHINSLPQSLPQLEVLEMSRTTNVTDELLKQIAQFCSSLKKLDVSHTGITDVGIGHLAASGTYPLEFLTLNETKITDTSVRNHFGRMPRLKVIHAAKCLITTAAVDQFCQEYPHTTLRHQYSDVNSHGKVGGGLWHIPLDD